jgi:DUF1707 SHOCT-like domain
MAEPSLWQRFEHDPRSRTFASLRASYADREVVQQVLSEAYATGRLDAVEFEERTDSAQTVRTLGELPPLLADLVPDLSPVVDRPGALVGSDELQLRAVAHWEKQRREALLGFLGPSLICWVIWGATMFGGFPWPLFVMLGTGVNALATQVKRTDIIDAERRRLERKQARLLEKEQRRELEGPGTTD